MGGRGHPASAAVASCQHQFQFFERELSTAGLDKRAHNPPTHLIKESIGFDDEREEPSAPFNVAASQGANGGLHFVVPRSGKRFEIMLANEKVRRSSHDPEIQLVRNLPCRVAEQGIHRGMIPDKKAVLFSGRVEPCMKCVRTMRRRKNPYVLRQKRVQSERYFRERHFEFVRRNLHVSHHTQGMHTGISPARTVNAPNGWEKFGECFLDLLLYTQAGFLHLPAGVVGAVVGNHELELDRVHRT